MKIYILHHNDTDGYAAAAAFSFYHSGFVNGDLLKVPTKIDSGYFSPVEYHAVDYGTPLPEIEDGSIVYILDFSVSLEVLNDLASRMKSVLILDHHVSAMRKLKDHPLAIFDMDKSGASLAWEYFGKYFGNYKEPTDFIRYVEDQDLGKYNLPNSKDIKHFLYSIPLTVGNYVARLFMNYEDMRDYGQIVTRYVDTTIENAISMAHIIEVDEYKMLAMSSSVMYDDIGSMLRTKIKEYGCDFAGTYYRFDRDNYKFSFRGTKDFPVDGIAERFGGGGHSGAAGMMLPVSNFDGYRIRSND